MAAQAEASAQKQPVFFGFPLNYWVVIFFEFMERGSYYGLMSVLSVYLVMATSQGGCGFTKESVGWIKATIQPLLYLLPIVSGALADRFGYRRALMLAFSLLGLGYFLAGNTQDYVLVFGSLIIMAFGAGTFKPIISGTIARVTNEKNSTLGFGIFYWTINMGAFLFPLILVPWLKGMSWKYVFYMSALGTSLCLIPNLLFYREPKRPESSKTLAEVGVETVMVLKDFKFISMVLIYSGFWILYFQQFDTVLWYLKEHMDMKPVDAFVNHILANLHIPGSFHFDAEHVTVLNALTIISLQMVISSIVKHTKALPTMITGISIATLGMALLSLSPSPWLFVVGIVVFSIGEMTAHPKYISYVGQIAPRDKVATYMGFGFLYGVFGSFFGGAIGPVCYNYFDKTLHQPRMLWAFFALFGIATIVGLILYNRFVAAKIPPADDSDAAAA
jgi:proton-dependent oligopeptide transporter, POT family